MAETLSLNDNEVAMMCGYRCVVAGICPALKELDNLPLDGTETEHLVRLS